MRICYIPRNFKAATRDRLDQANEIIDEYAEQGLDLTLRQLYYQFVSRGLLPNEDNEYNKLKDIINDGRLAGEIDWDAIVDITRVMRGAQLWDSPHQILNAAINSFRVDRWAAQEFRPEVWIEKDALIGPIQKPCDDNYLQYFSTRGYPSQSSVWRAAQRFLEMIQNGQTPVVIHMGDHDPSGIDMTRDIQERLDMFLAAESEAGTVEVKRVALNMDQVDQYNPPPNPAKLTDKRAPKYIKKYGRFSWELDALEPKTLHNLISDAADEYVDDVDAWNEAMEREKKQRDQLSGLMRHLP